MIWMPRVDVETSECPSRVSQTLLLSCLLSVHCFVNVCLDTRCQWDVDGSSVRVCVSRVHVCLCDNLVSVFELQPVSNYSIYLLESLFFRPRDVD
jgi:hypothetical protein